MTSDKTPRPAADADAGAPPDDEQTVVLAAQDEAAEDEKTAALAVPGPAQAAAERPELDGDDPETVLIPAAPPVEGAADDAVTVEAAAAPPGEQLAAVAGRAEPGRHRPWWHVLRGPVAVAFLCGALGFALAAQLNSNDEEDTRLATMRQSDLVRILDELDSRERRLRAEISDLEFRHQTLSSRTQGSEAALADAQRRAAELAILAGTGPAEGPGLVVTIDEGKGQLAYDRLLDAVQELRGAGAEAITVGGAGGNTVRLGASSYFADSGDDLDVDGTRLAGPYTITAIGDPPTMDKALRIPGGVVQVIRQDGCSITLEQRRTVQITAIRPAKAPRFAEPAS